MAAAGYTKAADLPNNRASTRRLRGRRRMAAACRSSLARMSDDAPVRIQFEAASPQPSPSSAEGAQSEARPESESGFAPVYMIEVLLDEAAKVDAPRLLASLRAQLGAVEPLDEGGTSAHFAFPELLVEYRDGSKLPAQLIVTDVDTPVRSQAPQAPQESQGARLAEAVQQTWDWDAAGAAVGRARATWLVTDFLAGGLPPRDRLRLALAGVTAVLEQAGAHALAVHWKPAQRLLDPATFAAKAAEDPVGRAVNVRLFNISDRAPGEIVMDTIGLAALGIPDFQIHFLGLDPGRVAGFLYALARHVHQRGAVIGDGDTVPGPKPGEKWKVRLEQALMEPRRFVLDIEPNGANSARGAKA
jgi:hypothetical protein